jgi:type IV pilus assembly protein PilF
VGTTVTNAAYNENERRARGSYKSRSEWATEVAIANLNLGVEYMRQGNYEMALEKLNRAKMARNDYAPIHNALGLVYQQIGETEAAEINFMRAIKLEPTDSASLNNYGLFLCQNQRFDEADEYFLKAANNPLYSTPELAITNAGTCALSDGQFDKADNYFREALKRNPRVAPALIQMAELSYEQGKYLPARGYLQRYLELTKHTPKSLWLGIRIESELGDNNAVSSYALLLRNNYPDTKEATLLKEFRAQ